jgi:hypothetical protein
MKLLNLKTETEKIVKPIVITVKGSKKLLMLMIAKYQTENPELADKICLVNSVKVRSKVTQVPRSRDELNNRLKASTKEKSWTGYLYFFDKDEIDQYVQYPRYFRLYGDIVDCSWKDLVFPKGKMKLAHERASKFFLTIENDPNIKLDKI